MGRMAVTVGAAYIAAVSVVAQQQPQVFEVASVRRNSSLEVRGSAPKLAQFRPTCSPYRELMDDWVHECVLPRSIVEMTKR